MGCVRHHRGVPEKEGMTATILNEVADRLEPLAADPQSLSTCQKRHAAIEWSQAFVACGRIFVRADAAGHRPARRHPVSETGVDVVSFPPLTGLKAPIPARCQQLRQRREPFKPLADTRLGQFQPPAVLSLAERQNRQLEAVQASSA